MSTGRRLAQLGHPLALAILVFIVILGVSSNGYGGCFSFPPGLFAASREELAEYHFHLGQFYEIAGYVGKAHLHYEIIHDCYKGSRQYWEATLRMTQLRNTPRCVLVVPGFFHGCDDWKPNFETPSINPQTFAAIQSIWAKETKDSVEEMRQIGESLSLLDYLPAHYHPSILKGIPFKEGRFQLFEIPFNDLRSMDRSKGVNEDTPWPTFEIKFGGPNNQGPFIF